MLDFISINRYVAPDISAFSDPRFGLCNDSDRKLSIFYRISWTLNQHTPGQTFVFRRMSLGSCNFRLTSLFHGEHFTECHTIVFLTTEPGDHSNAESSRWEHSDGTVCVITQESSFSRRRNLKVWPLKCRKLSMRTFWWYCLCYYSRKFIFS